jgi:rhodanese-related sulfurtransferase
MKKVVLVVLMVLMVGVHGQLMAGDAPRMTKEQLKAELGNPDVVIMDVRVPHAWNEARDKIKGAVREDPMTVESWIDKYPKDKTYVFYCN